MRSEALAPPVWFPFVNLNAFLKPKVYGVVPVSYTHLRAHETS